MSEAYVALTLRVRVNSDDKWDARRHAERVASALNTLLKGDTHISTSLVDESETGAVQQLLAAVPR